MGVRVVSAHSTAELLPLLAERLTGKRDDPFAPDLVVVPGRGMIDWLQESLSPMMGPSSIVANVHFWLPNEFNSNAGAHVVEPLDRWGVESLQWRVLEVLSVAHNVGEELAPGFRVAQRKADFARRVAELYDSYVVHRPEMVRAWSLGQDTDGFRPLPVRHKWQPLLWRKVLATASGISIDGAAIQVRMHPLVESAQITFFGLEAFSRSKVELIRSLGNSHDLLVLNVSPTEGLVESFMSRNVVLETLRRDFETYTHVRNPLLASWAWPAMESAALLASVAGEATFVTSSRKDTVLGSLQNALGNDLAAQQGATESLLKQGDGSIQVHTCHGATRQVEVLRDAILHLFAQDSTLTPRDVLVVCPDLERFSPVIEPIMASKIGPDGSHLRVSIVDRSNATVAPISVAISAVLSLVDSRCTALDVLEVLSLDPVRKRFDFDETELVRVVSWVTSLNVQWGLDLAQRQEWGYPVDEEAGTWEWAIDRLITGIMLQSPEVFEDAPGLAAFDEISGNDIPTVGKLDRFYRELVELRSMIDRTQTLVEWSSVLGHLVENFIRPERDEVDHLLDVRHLIENLNRFGLLAPTARVSLQDISQHLSSSLPSVRGRAARWSDVIRVGSLSQFRGVPARVVAILGFDAEALKGAGGGGDDVLLEQPWIGERDGRSDERLALLSTIHAARDFFLITCDGYDVNDNSKLPVPVPLEQIKEAVACAIARIPETQRRALPVVIEHSRQLADSVNVSLPSDDPRKNVRDLVDGPWAFDSSVLHIVETISRLSRSGDSPPAGLGNPVLAPPEQKEIRQELSVDDLANALRRPAEVFLRERLGVSLPSDTDSPDPEIPLWPNHLDYGSLGRDLIEALSDGGESPESWFERRSLLGGLPLGDGLHALWDRLQSDSDGVIRRARTFLDGERTEVSVRVSVPDPESASAGLPNPILTGRILVWGTTVVSVNFSEWHRRMRLIPWLKLAMLTLQDPNTEWSAVVVGRAPKKKIKKSEEPERALLERFVLAGASGEERRESALTVLSFASTMRARARRCPVPLFERASWMLDAAKSTLETQLAYDLDRPHQRMIFGEKSLTDFRAEEPIAEIDEEILEAPSRMDGYAGLLIKTWTRSVVVVDPAEKPKASKSTKARVRSKNDAAGEDER